MLLVLLCGFPASGKTLIAHALSTFYASNNLKVSHIVDGAVHASSSSTPSPSAPRASLYETSLAEKSTRGRLKSAAERALAPNTAVIVDSLNYIKGFRYELFCVAKAASARYVVIHARAPPETCLAQDAARPDAYGPALVAALIARFEEPSSRNRWDSPLHVVEMHRPPPGAPGCDAWLPWRDEVRRVAEASLGDAPLRGSFATRKKPVVGADVMAALDRATRGAEAGIVERIRAGTGAGEMIDVPGGGKKLFLARKVGVTELRGFRRAHLNLVKIHPPQSADEAALVDAYVDYVSAQLKGG